MKNLFIALTIMASTLASAADIKLIEKPAYGENFSSATFVVNQELGRVWIEVETLDRRFPETEYSTKKVKVEGLTYDAETKNVTIEHEGRSVVCGTLIKRRFVVVNLWEVRKSGNCTFNYNKINLAVDDGFEVRMVRYLQVFMNVK